MNLSADSKVLLQGVMEPLGATYGPIMRACGTQVVAGVSPGYGGHCLGDIPIFDLVEQAIAAIGSIDTTVIFVEPYLALDAALEAITMGIRQLVIVTEGIPPLDMVQLLRVAEATETLVVGPNCPGIIIPGQLMLGTHPPEFYTPGCVGLISRSSSLTYEVALELSQAGLGQSISIGIGSDAIIGSSFPQWLQILDEDDRTEVIVLVGEVGGDGEEAAARYIAEAIDKPVVAYIAGRTVSIGKQASQSDTLMVMSQRLESKTGKTRAELGTAESKLAALKHARIPTARRPSEIPALVKKALKSLEKQSEPV